MTVDGQWKIIIKTPMGPQAGTLDLVTDGNTLSGRATVRDDDLEIKNGTVDGTTLSWELKVRRPLPMTGHFNATVDGDKLTGTAKLGPMGNAPFEGTRVTDDEKAG